MICGSTVASSRELAYDDQSGPKSWALSTRSNEVDSVCGKSEDNYSIELIGVRCDLDPFRRHPDYDRRLSVTELKMVDETSEGADGIVIGVPLLP